MLRCGSEATCWFVIITGSVFIDGAVFHPPNWSVAYKLDLYSSFQHNLNEFVVIAVDAVLFQSMSALCDM